ncbi:thiol-disulfide oxidoreductase DCC family protein [Thermaerobacillus caldiproteolyticus]|uniref:thiol-disulfide oxidoreductase DCC family protein n=1 Tax=Thermaerobacillus caldiproteolyticus TaxID=247480 RepID=UPI00188A43BA|nr:thiol-disulfide oxidoreductase DCC family protein [Anoxybacillus caldiproteolyticus]QPA32791.1 thiol-disulfide oxidoreductase DCC family protein [Anoxybacillus caldiproteolyticus]
MELIILFDGICNFCNASVHFIIKRDPQARFRFAPLQSEAGRKMLAKYGIPEDMGSLIVIDGERYYTKSSAALRVCKYLKGFWKLFYVFILVPRPIRDRFYHFIAENRYKWFGKRESCMIPTPDIRKRFLE